MIAVKAFVFFQWPEGPNFFGVDYAHNDDSARRSTLFVDPSDQWPLFVDHLGPVMLS